MAYTFKHGDRPVDGYTIQRAVGRGGFGEVYYAVSDGGREVAIKYLRDNPQIELRGVSHCINLKSPHLVSIFDVRKTEDGEYAIIMEYCSGPSLRDLLIAEPNGFGPQKAGFFLKEIAKGLAYLHDRGIVHRDLKPGNLFYDDGYLKIGDYGLSKFISVSRHSAQTASVGTVHYMAPEIGSGNYSRGVDIYALGVILYEMLLGKVPFDGSSMAEVLMKHLTTQPELESLPHPFGKVIRKALEKDPNDRYQTVDEMVEDLFDVDEIRESVAGFRPQSLEGAVRHGGQQYDSPMPSPNPAPGFSPADAEAAAAPGPPPFAQPLGTGGPLPKRVARRMDRLSRRLEKKMAKLAGRPVRPRRHNQANAETLPSQPFAPANRKRRIALSALLSVGLAIGLGILVGNTWDSAGAEELGVATSMLVLTMSGGIVVSRGAAKWFGAEQGPRWSQQLITMCCCTPLMAMGFAPISDLPGDRGVVLWLGLLALAILGRWDKDIERSSNGELSFGYALWAAFVGMIFTGVASAISNTDPEELVLVGGGIAGAVSLIVQGTGWWLPSKASVVMDRMGGDQALDKGDAIPDGMHHAIDGTEQAMPNAARNHDRMVVGGGAPNFGTDSSHDPTVRWGVTRAFWALVTFAAMGGTLTTLLLATLARKIPYDEVSGIIVGCVACASFMLFSLRRIGPVRKVGFWRETLRPFLLTALLFGSGATTANFARYWDAGKGLDDESRIGLLVGMIMCSIGLLLVLIFTGGRPRQPQPFLQPEAGAQSSGAIADAVDGPPRANTT